MLIVGELINSTRKRIHPLLQARQGPAIVDLARRQVEAGAHLVDVNCATLMDDETECLGWAIRTIQDALDVRISIDSPNPRALRRGLETHRGKALLNSITLERERWANLLPMVQEHRPGAVALCLDDEGIPATAEGRLALAGRLVEGLTRAGLPSADIYLDPLLLPVATNSRAAAEFLEAIDLIKKHFPDVHVVCGLSNVSFGLPLRPQVNQTFLVLCMAHGMDACILDPLDRRLMASVTTARMLLGHDDDCQGYIGAVRAGKFDFMEPGPQRRGRTI